MALTRFINLDQLVDTVSADVEAYFSDIEVEAGILQEALYKNGASLQDVARRLNERYNWLEHGLNTDQNMDLKTAIQIVVDGISKGIFSEQQFCNAVAAVFINPINRKEFGDNAPSTIARKGFNHVMVHTGLFISKIKARLTQGVKNV